MYQLSLNVHLQNTFSFENFYSSMANQELLMLLKEEVDPQFKQLFIWGDSGSGKTHLLQAYCNALQSTNQMLFYLPLRRYASYGAKILVGMGRYQVLVIDDIDTVIGGVEWEELLYGLISERHQRGQVLIFSAQSEPHELTCVLPNLRSRLMWGLHYRLANLEEDELAIAMKWLAHQRGFELNETVVDYITRRFPLKMKCLSAIIEYLDRQSLKDGRKVTRHFAQQTLKDFSC